MLGKERLKAEASKRKSSMKERGEPRSQEKANRQAKRRGKPPLNEKTSVQQNFQKS